MRRNLIPLRITKQDNQMKFDDIRSRLTYQFMMLVVAILLLFSVGVYFFSKLYLEKRFFKRLEDRAVTTTTLLFDLQAANTTIMKLVHVSDKELLNDEQISIYNEATKQLIFSTSQAHRLPILDLIEQKKGSTKAIHTQVGDYQVFAVSIKDKQINYWVVVAAIDRIGADALADLRRILVVMVLIGVLLLGLSGWVFAGRALAPMSSIVHQVNEIFPANVTRRVEHSNKTDEIGVLVATFNQLLDRIEEALTMQKLFIANVSHELKNPLTKIFSQVEIALMQPRSQEEYQHSLQSLQEDTKTLVQLTNTLLDLANTVGSTNNINLVPIRLDELLWDTKSQMQKWNSDYQVKLNFLEFPDNEESLTILGNEASLKVLFMNLMDNACKFSDNKTVVINFTATATIIRVALVNTGSMIPKADFPYIFNPFYRSNATAKGVKGHGVGLAIVAQIVKVHSATIEVFSDKNATTFLVQFDSIK